MALRTLPLLAALLLAPPNLHASQGQHWHELRSLGFSLSANLLAYHSEYEDIADPRRVDAYQQALQSIRLHATHLQDAELLSLSQTLEEQVGLLERQPATDIYRLPQLLNPILHSQAELDSLAGQHLTRQATDPRLTRLHQLSLDCSRILLLYQIRTYRFAVQTYFMTREEDSFEHLDQRIGEHFTALANDPQLEPALQRAQRHYLFVRDKLVNHDQNWAPGGAATYLGLSISTLDELARAIQQ